MEENKGLERRDFLKFGLAGLAVAVAGPTLAGRSDPEKTSPEAKENSHSWAMVIDQSHCVGCGHCIQTCKADNDTHPDIEWTRLVEGDKVNGKQTYIPIPCMHCRDAPCIHYCPAGATYHREDGIVMMNYDRCFGCRYCEVACPYGARSFNWEAFDGDNPAVPAWGIPEVARRPRGVVEKCSFCYQRIDRGLEQGLTPGVDAAATPACVVACPMGARIFGDLNDPESPASKALDSHGHFQLKEGLGTDPRVYYLPAHRGAQEEEG